MKHIDLFVNIKSLYMNDTPKIIAFDGTAASGKGTIAKIVAKKFSFDYLDTGKLFRKIAYLYLLKKHNIQFNIVIKNYNFFEFNNVNSKFLFTDLISNTASYLAQDLLIRTFIQKKQKEFVREKKIVVIDGRDIGTVVFPDAEIKFFFDANLEVRSKRRFKQLHNKVNNITLGGVLKNLRTRDIRDKNRLIAPLVSSKDSINIDTTLPTINAILKQIVYKINKKLNTQ